MNDTTPQINGGRFFAEWMLTFLGFPLGGVMVFSFLGPMTDTINAALGGAVVGILVGLMQWIILLRHLGMRAAWILSTASGLALGNTIGVILTDGGTETGDLLLLGFAAGAGVGLAQWSMLRRYLKLAAIWPPVVALCWPLGWLVTSSVGVNIDFGYAVFDTLGALVFVALTGAAMLVMVRTSNTAKRASMETSNTEDPV